MVVLDGRDLLLAGAWITIKLFFASVGVVLVISVLAGTARLAPWRALRVAVTCYVEFCRGVSLYVQLFWLYFALPFLGITLEVWDAAVLGLGLVHGAYGSELVRGALQAIPKAQYEAAQALNMTRLQRMRYVIFPQAVPAMIPLFGNEFILLLKATSVCSLITLAELSFSAHAIVTRTHTPGTIFTVVLATYFLMALVITHLVRWAERALTGWKHPSARQAA